MPWLEDLKFPRGYQMGTHKKDILLNLFKEKNITIRNYADTSFRITIGTSEENEMVLDVLRRFEYANS